MDLTPGLREGHHGIGVRSHGEDGHADVEIVVFQHLVPRLVSGHAEAPRGEIKIRAVGVGDGDDLAQRVYVEGPRSRHSGPARSDQSDLVFRVLAHSRASSILASGTSV